MPRYVVERTLPEWWTIPDVDAHAFDGVMWLHSYVSEDAKRMFCVYEAPNPEAIRKISARNELPVERITQVRVLDPYSYA
jgi:Protein of unknown function (DUF4242)